MNDIRETFSWGVQLRLLNCSADFFYSSVASSRVVIGRRNSLPLSDWSNLKLEGLGLFPGEEVPTKVSVAGRLLEDGILQLQVPAKKMFI
jgi:hypothetical protein